jgi:hypothetical protein
MDQSTLERVMRDIREAEARAKHQRRVLDRLTQANVPAQEAKALLAKLELNLANQRVQLDLLLKSSRAA